MIKLVVSDIDGTLVNDGAHNLNPRMFEVIRQLKKKGILFAAASGRQYPSIRRLFAPVEHDMIFIAENGAYVVCRDTEISITPMDPDAVREIVCQVRQIPGCIITASGKQTTYIEQDDQDFIDFLVNGYHNNVRLVEDVLETGEDIVKVAIYRKDGIDSLAETMIPQWKDRVKVVVSGSMWLDFMDDCVDKGNAIASIQKSTCISKEETMCFGDNSNDVGMFRQAGTCYAVANANPILKKEATAVIETYKEDAVLKELEKLL